MKTNSLILYKQKLKGFLKALFNILGFIQNNFKGKRISLLT